MHFSVSATATKQSEARERVLALIEHARDRRRDPVRAPALRRSGLLAADGPSRARRSRPRRLPRPQAGQRDVRQRAEDRPGADDDLVHRGHAPAGDGAGQPHARPAHDLCRPVVGPNPARLALGADRRRQAPPPRRRTRRWRSRRCTCGPRSCPGCRPTTSRRSPSTRCSATGTASTSSAALQTIEPTVTNEEESEALGVPLHSPAFLFERTTRSSAGEIVEYVRSLYRGDRYRHRHRAQPAAPPALMVSTTWSQLGEETASHVRMNMRNGESALPKVVLTSRGKVCQSRAVTKWSSPIRRPSAVPQDGRISMKARIIGAAVLAAVCAVAATSATGGTKKAQADITVWLQVDAQSGWPDVVAAATAAFEKQHPGVGVKVQYQTWGTHLGKFDATLAGGNTPDVIEMGNTEMTKYMAAGAFQDLTSAQVLVRQLRAAGSRASRRRAATTASSTASRTTPARASSPTAPTSTARPGSRRRRRASPSSRRTRRS